MGPYRAVTSSTALVDVHCQSSLFVLALGSKSTFSPTGTSREVALKEV